jgi:hypothetical protein
MKSYKYIVVLLFFVFYHFSALQAQSDDVTYYKSPIVKDTSKIRYYDWLSKLSVGGNFGLSFTPSIINIELSPHIAYHPVDWFATGLGFTYMFYHFRNVTNASIASSHIAGGSVFTEAYFLKFLCVHAEYQLLNYDNFWKTNVMDPHRLWSNNLLLGGGFYQKSTDKFAVYVLILYNISNRPDENVLTSPVVKTGFTIWLK